VTAWLGVGVAFGPLALLMLWMLLLNRRDRCRDALEATVGVCCTELGLRGAFAVHARVGMLFGGVQVVLDMRLCTTGEVWQVIERLPPRLPPGAKLCIVATGPRRRHSWVPLPNVDIRLLAVFHRAGSAQAGGIAPVRSTIRR
jgi:hypothetical protein